MDVAHDAARHRFSATVEGHECEIDYRLADGVMTITHTGVPSQIGGRGHASALTQFAMDHARAQGWKVIPACSYAAAWMRRHPEYDDLRA